MTYKVINDGTIELLPKTAADASIIWIHGLGASGDDLVPLANELRLATNNIRYIFPNAPFRSITVNGGIKLRAWYDIKSFDLSMYYDHQNHEGILSSQSIINNLIEKEINCGIKSDRIILAGFSQGGAVALHTGLRFNKKLAGIICLSGYLPQSSLLNQDRSLVNQSIPIFMAHGLLDPIVPIIIAEKSFDFLVSLNYKVTWHSYMMQHNIIDTEINHLTKFLNNLLQ